MIDIIESTYEEMHKRMELVKQTQEAFRDNYGPEIEYSNGHHIQDHYCKDDWKDGLRDEHIWNELSDEFTEAIDTISQDHPIHKNLEMFEKAVKIAWVLNNGNLYEEFFQTYPEYKELLDYLLAFAIRSGKAIELMAPQYNDIY